MREEQRIADIKRRIRAVAEAAAQHDLERNASPDPFWWYEDTVVCDTCNDIGRILTQKQSKLGYETTFAHACPDCEKGKLFNDQDKIDKLKAQERRDAWRKKQENRKLSEHEKTMQRLGSIAADDIPF